MQNWDIVQDHSGVIFIANNEGMLAFDGKHWQLLHLPNKTIVRSLAFDPVKERIYAGGQDEIGYFAKNSRGFYYFTSIKKYIPEDFDQFGDVWTMNYTPKGIFFRANERLYHWHDGTINVFTSTNGYPFLDELNQTVVVQDFDGTFFSFEQQPEKVDLPRAIPGIIAVNGISEDSILIATEKNGMYLFLNNKIVKPFNPGLQSLLSEKNILDVEVLKNGNIAVGTSLGGLIITDPKGNPIHLLNKSTGLQNNRVRKVFQDQDENLWLGLENGIDYVEIAQPYTVVYPDGKLEGASYSVKIHQNNLYVGTSNGLYALPWQDYYDPISRAATFTAVPNTSGQVWGMSILYDCLFLGHHDGAFIVEDKTVKKISPNIGYWTFNKLKNSSDDIIAGHYTGISVLSKNQQESWSFDKVPDGFGESSRFMVIQADTVVWVSHPYRGVFKLNLHPDIKQVDSIRYDSSKGLPDLLGNHIFKVRNDIFVCGAQGVFYYDEQKDYFYPYQPLNDILGKSTKIRRLFEDNKGNIWYVTQDEIGFLEIEINGLEQKITNYKLNDIHRMLVGGFEYIYPYDASNVFIGAEKGMIHVDPSRMKNRKFEFKTLITAVNLLQKKDSLVFVNQIDTDKNDIPKFDHENCSFRFLFAATSFSQFNTPFFQYQLEGFDKEWSEWTSLQSREYTNLKPGAYTFRVRSGIPGEFTANTAAFSFYIESPWYATTAAYSSYFILFLIGISSLIWIPRRKFEKQKARLELEKNQKVAAHQAEAEQSKEKLIELKNEKLKAEIAHKNKELSSTTMHLLQKSELIQRIKSELSKLGKITKEQQTQKELNRIIRILKEDDVLDKEWEQFFVHFDQVHNQFFQRLRKAYPDLTAKDQKLCAYLRMNLTSKEIAPLMNISTRGVEISRYRLRKKLNLESQVNLNEFMMAF